MTKYLTVLLSSLGIGESLSMFIISIVPFIELRGGVLWGHALGMNPLKVFLICFLSNCIPIPFVILLARPIFSWLKKLSIFRGLVTKVENLIEKKADKVKSNKYEMLGLFLFVAVPLPGTGAYTGSLIAALLKMRLKHAVPAIVAGVFVAGLIMTLASMGLFSFLGFAF